MFLRLIELFAIVGGFYALYLWVRRIWREASLDDKLSENQEINDMYGKLEAVKDELPQVKRQKRELEKFLNER